MNEYTVASNFPGPPLSKKYPVTDSDSDSSIDSLPDSLAKSLSPNTNHLSKDLIQEKKTDENSETNNEAKNLYNQQLTQLLLELDSVDKETHPDLMELFLSAESKLKNQLDIALDRRNHLIFSAQLQFETTQYAAECQFLAEKRNLRRNLLDQLENDLASLKHEKRRIDSFPSHDRDRILPVKKRHLPIFFPRHRFFNPSLAKTSKPKGLSLDEVEHDLTLFLKSSSSHSISSNQSQQPASPAPSCDNLSQDIDKQSFSIQGQLLNKGDLITVDDEALGRFTARYVSINHDEIVIQKTDGSKTKLSLSNLQRSTCQITLRS